MAVSEEQLAAAIMAKITGNTLKKVDESTLVPVGMGPANKVDPMKFVSSNNNVIITQQQQKEIEERNREAERLYPLPSQPLTPPLPSLPSVTSAPVLQQEYDPQLFLPLTYDIPVAKAATTELIDTLKSVNNNLSKLANLFEEWLTR